MTWDVAPAADLITQPFGCTDVLQEWLAPWCPSHRFHSGIDLGSSRGGWAIYKTPVYATRPGTVVAIGEPYLGDQAVCLQLDGGLGWLWYGHLEAALVVMGERVAVGQDVGQLGTRGDSTAPHLHLEHRLDGIARNVDHQAAGVADPTWLLYDAPVPPDLPPVPKGWQVVPLGGALKAVTPMVQLSNGRVTFVGIGTDDQPYQYITDPTP